MFVQDPCSHDIIWEAFTERNLPSTFEVHVSVVSAPKSRGNPCVASKRRVRNVF